MSFRVAAFYKFALLDTERIAEIRDLLVALAAPGAAQSTAPPEDLRGLVLLGSEGINGTIAGSDDRIGQFQRALTALPEFGDIVFKESRAAKNPFRRYKIDLRKELITQRSEVETTALPVKNNHLSPAEWQALLDESPDDVVLVDTRNRYETQLGKFRGAFDPQIDAFSQFTKVAEAGVIPRDKKVLMYCTGGIRCEKAIGDMQRAGYPEVYQLEGGILKYLEEFPNRNFDGECFVFDHRVAVDQDLQPSKQFGLCPHCGNPAVEIIACSKCGTERRVCASCMQIEDRRSCSKNCAHHLRLKAERNARI